MEKEKHLNNHDIMLIVLIIVATLGLIVYNTRQSSNDLLVVEQGNTLLLQLSRDEMKKDSIYEFDFDGGTGYIEVKNQKVRMLPMDISICPNNICSKTGWINGKLMSIVCLPNRLSVSFKSNQISEIDDIVF